MAGICRVAKLAAELGASQRTVAYCESPATTPPANLLPQIAAALVSIDELFGVGAKRRLVKQLTPSLWVRSTEGVPMNATVEQSLLSKIRTLSPQQVAEVEDFVEFLAARSNKHAALDRLLAIAPALEAAGVTPMSEDEIAAEIKAARAERRARAQGQAKDSGADRS